MAIPKFVAAIAEALGSPAACAAIFAACVTTSVIALFAKQSILGVVANARRFHIGPKGFEFESKDSDSKPQD